VSRLHGGTHLESAAQAFAAVLGRELDCATRVQIADDYPSLSAALLAGTAHVAWLPPLPLARVVQEGGVLAALAERRGQLSYRSAILVQRGAPIAEVRDLRGARAAWSNPSSAGGYLMPRAHLAEQGLDLSSLAGERFYGATAACCAAVVAGEADFATCYVSDAAGSDEHTRAAELTGTLGAEVSAALRVLTVTPPIPPDGIVLSARLEATRRAALRTVLLELDRAPGGSEALRALLQAERLAPATYESMRLLTRLSAAAPE
jgi:phosphonate transport system substrate-binding protein